MFTNVQFVKQTFSQLGELLNVVVKQFNDQEQDSSDYNKLLTTVDNMIATANLPRIA